MHPGAFGSAAHHIGSFASGDYPSALMVAGMATAKYAAAKKFYHDTSAAAVAANQSLFQQSVHQQPQNQHAHANTHQQHSSMWNSGGVAPATSTPAELQLLSRLYAGAATGFGSQPSTLTSLLSAAAAMSSAPQSAATCFNTTPCWQPTTVDY